MKIAVVGSRGYPDSEEVMQFVLNTFKPEDILVSGGARGVDSWAQEAATALGCETYVYVPDWQLLGRGAGFARNKQIVDECDRLVAFWDGKSRGTKHSIDLALGQGKPVEVHLP